MTGRAPPSSATPAAAEKPRAPSTAKPPFMVDGVAFARPFDAIKTKRSFAIRRVWAANAR